MTTLEEAIKLAEEFRHKEVNFVEEYPDYYILRHTEDPLSDGGFEAPVIVNKNTGERMFLQVYCLEYNGAGISDEEMIRTYNV